MTEGRGGAEPLSSPAVLLSSAFGPPDDGPPRLTPREAHDQLAVKLDVASADLDGWQVATQITRTGFTLPSRELREYARKVSTQAVLRRAARLVGPIRRAARPRYDTMREPFRGELDVDRTLENLAGKSLGFGAAGGAPPAAPFPSPDDWIVELREEAAQQVVLMMDASLSMAGENMAIAAVAAAVLALKMRPEDLSVIVFEDSAHVITRLDEYESPEGLVDRILSQPVRGYTNIEDGLRSGAVECRRGRNPAKAGLLITDGVFTRGADPGALAADFPRLFVVLTEDYKMNEELCYRLARVGRGDVFRVKHHSELPKRMLEIANRVLR